MPDITMCKDQDCPKKDNCYRFTATPDELQIYYVNSPWFNNQCEFFWDNQHHETIRRTS